jgi:hypothetical protein
MVYEPLTGVLALPVASFISAGEGAAIVSETKCADIECSTTGAGA